MDQGSVISYKDKTTGNRSLVEIERTGIPGAPIMVKPYVGNDRKPYPLDLDKGKEVQGQENIKEPGQWHRLTIQEVVGLKKLLS